VILQATRPVIGIVGWKNSGKTTLVESLVGELTRRGLRVSTIKHAHHDCEIDKPGKDSYRHRQAGAQEVIVSSAKRWALVHELDDESEPSLAGLLSHLSSCDLVLVEGMKSETFDKILVVRGKNDPPWNLCTGICAVASDEPASAGPFQSLPLNEPRVITDFLVARYQLEKRTRLARCDFSISAQSGAPT